MLTMRFPEGSARLARVLGGKVQTLSWHLTDLSRLTANL